MQICDADFPWCVEGSCNALTDNPWHDVGMSKAKLEWAMCLLPLLGGAMGALFGGVVADRAAKVTCLFTVTSSPTSLSRVLTTSYLFFLCLIDHEQRTQEK